MSQIYLSQNLFEGTDGSTTLTDEIPGNTWSINANAEIDTAQAQAGNSSLLVPVGVNEWADGTGWASPHLCLQWDLTWYVRWDDAYAVGESWKVSLLNNAGDNAAIVYLEGDGDLWMATDGTQGSGTQGANVAPLNVGQWYKAGISRISETTFNLYWEDVLVSQQVWGGTQDTKSIDKLRVENNTTTSNIWFDNTLLIGCGPQVVDSAEFDYEIQGNISLEQIVAPGETTFLDRSNADRCRRVVVPECIRRKRATGACRLIVAKPTVLH